MRPITSYADQSQLSGLSDQIGLLTPSTAEQAEAARRYVAARARGADDLRGLLDALGLRPA